MTVPSHVVIGGGPWGLTSARALALQGASVTLLDDRQPGAGSVAAGMLGPWTESEVGRDVLFDLLVASATAWPDYAASLGTDRGGYHECGTLLAAGRREDVALLRHRRDAIVRRGVRAEWLTGSALRELEPALGTAVIGGVHLPDEHQADPRLLMAALARSCAETGVRTVSSAAVELVRREGVVVGAVDAEGQTHHGTVVLAAGWQSHRLSDRVPVRGVKGQILRLQSPGGEAPSMTHVVRGGGVYVVPRPSGEVIVGATMEERTDGDVLAGDVQLMLDDALDLVPDLRHFSLREASAGVRPASEDGMPVVGRDHEGVLWATGGFRHGILLAPLVGPAIARAAEGDPEPLAGCGPGRFTRVAPATEVSPC